MNNLKEYTRVYTKAISGLLKNRTFILSQSGSRAKLHSVGEIDIATLRDDDLENHLREGVLLFMHADADDDAIVKVMYADETVNEIAVWKLKASCTEVIKIIDTGTTVDNSLMFLSK